MFYCMFYFICDRSLNLDFEHFPSSEVTSERSEDVFFSHSAIG